MRILGFHIDGFGVFHEVSLQDLPKGLALFVGRNESGKTTLMEFIRTVLFGFSRRGNSNDYPPLAGGRHGGTLHVLMQDGRQFTIDRTGHSVTLAEDGGPADRSEPSERLLSGLDRQTFERVFAIGLDDLRGLDVLSQERVRTRLFAAGAGLGAASVPRAMETLDTEMNNLLSQRGRQQRINKLTRSLDEARSNILRVQGRASEYAECHEKRRKLKEEIEKAQVESENIRQRLRRIDQLTKARERWVPLCTARENAAKVASGRTYPTNGLERFETLKRSIEEIGQDKKRYEHDAERLEKQLTDLTVNEALTHHAEAIEALVGERQKLIAALDEHPTLERKMLEAGREFKRRLRELGAHWSSERLAEVDTSVQVREHVQDFERRLAGAERKHEEAQAYGRTVQDAQTEAKQSALKAKERLEKLPKPRVMDDQKLRASREAVRTMRSLFHERDVVNTQLEAKRSGQKEAEARFASLERQIDVPVRQVPSSAPILALLAGLAPAALLAFEGLQVPAIAVLLLGILMAVFLLSIRRRGSKAEKGRVSNLSSDLQQAEKIRRMHGDEAKKLQQRIGEIDKEINRLAQSAGLKRPDGLTQLERQAGQVEQAAEKLGEWKTREQEKKEADERWRETEVRFQEAEKKTKAAHEELQKIQKEWQGWLKERGFTDTIRPEGFEAVLQAVDNAQTAERTLKEVHQRLSQAEGYLNETRRKIRDLLDRCGKKPTGPEEEVKDLDALRRDLEAALEAERSRSELTRHLEAVRSEADRVGRQLSDKQAEVEALMKEASATSEDQFRRFSGQHTEWNTCQQEIESHELALRTIAGTAEAQKSLEAELSETEPLKLQAEEDRLRRQLDIFAGDVSDYEREVGSLEHRLDEMSQEKRLGDLLLEHGSLKEQLDDATKRWATLVVCRNLLGKAREVYERERQPQVIQEAGKFLQTITGPRYRLLSPVGDGGVELEDTAKRRKNEKTWSSGLADQVYLAIRLGLAREFGRHAEPLPVIFDDLLVRFDSARQLGAAKVILDFAREQQVLLFSCHPRIQRLVEKALDDTRFHDVSVATYAVSRGKIEKSERSAKTRPATAAATVTSARAHT